MNNYVLKFLLSLILLVLGLQINAQTYTLKFVSNQGNFEVMLYDFTPNHRDMILKEIESGTYKKANFNRVIQKFVVQGGELDDEILAKEARNPTEKPTRLAPEFHSKAFHKLGALGAGRDDNPSKGSYFNQIYFVVGKRINDFDLNSLEEKKGIKFTEEQRQTYLKIGGQPRLDHDYTVFGEITKGLDVILKMSQVDTDENDVPEDPIKFKIKIKKNSSKRIRRTSISLGAGFGNF